VQTTIQPENPELKTAYKLNRDNCRIDWNKPAQEIHDLIRGLSPYPAAWTIFRDNDQEWNVKIYEAKILHETHQQTIGKIIAGKKELKIAVTGGFMQVISLQFPGKKKMNAAEFLNGMAFSEAAMAI
jgi:methionyl-tRNA formyltransferase